MCLAKAYFTKASGSPIFQDIKALNVQGDSIQMETIFGEKKTVPGKIVSIDFSTSKIQIEEKSVSPSLSK